MQCLMRKKVKLSLSPLTWNIQSILDNVLLIVANGSMALFQNNFEGGVL